MCTCADRVSELEFKKIGNVSNIQGHSEKTTETISATGKAEHNINWLETASLRNLTQETSRLYNKYCNVNTVAAIQSILNEYSIPVLPVKHSLTDFEITANTLPAKSCKALRQTQQYSVR